MTKKLKTEKKTPKTSWFTKNFLRISSIFLMLINLVAFAQPGSLDTTFVSGTLSSPGNISSMVTQSDGKIIIGGTFISYNGTPINSIARINTDGTLDPSFNVGTGVNSNVTKLLLQADGKVVMVGFFTKYNGVTKNRIVRLNVDGTIDSTFKVIAGTNNKIYSAALQSDGKIIIAGVFNSYNGVSASKIARLNTDGTIDGSFAVGSGPNDWIYNMVIQPDGKIVIVGNFLSYNGITVNRVARITTTGALDNLLSFNAGTALLGANLYSYGVDLQSDGKIIIGGTFNTFNGSAKGNLVRLNSNGSTDNTFNFGGSSSNGTIYTLKVRSDDKILIGGIFDQYNGVIVPGRIACLNSDGTRDATFNAGGVGAAGTASYVLDIIQNSSRDIFIGGTFSSYNTVTRHKLAKLRKACTNASAAIVSASSYSICGTHSATLSVTGTLNDATNWEWYNAACGSGNIGSGTSIVVSPTATTTYYVRGEGGCTYTVACSNITINVNSPTVTVSSSLDSVCMGSFLPLNASGGLSYTWSPGNQTGASIAVGPLATTTYSVVGTDVNGCSNYATITIKAINCVPKTSLTPAWCNSTLTAIDANARPRCNPVTNATNYEWQFTDLSTGQIVLTKKRNAQWPDFYILSSFPNIQYNTTYSVKVRAYVGGIWGNYGVACKLTTPQATITTTKLQAAFCNSTLTTIDANVILTCDPLTGATDFEWEFTDVSTGQIALTRKRNAPWNSFPLTSYFPNIQYNKTYSIKIRAFINGGWAPFGLACNLTTPSALGGLTQLTPLFCNTTLPTLDASTRPRCNEVTGATNYEWTFTEVATGITVFTYQRNAQWPDLYLTAKFPNIKFSTTYNVQVRAYVNNVWGNFGNICTLTTPATSAGRLALTDYEMQDIDLKNNIIINAYPNPTNDILNLDFNVLPENTIIEIYNSIGEIVLTQSLDHTNNTIKTQHFATGLYNLKVISNNSFLHSQKIIKQ